jgi:hypothetical protein
MKRIGFQASKSKKLGGDRLLGRTSPLNRPPAELAIGDGLLIDELAKRLLGWRARPDRFLKSGREWIPKSRFNPFERLEDAFVLLDRAGATYTLLGSSAHPFTAKVQIDQHMGSASGAQKARVITTAIVRALKLEVTP